jgi:hypothetical protein
VGAVRCERHGTHVAGPFCCDHVREAVDYQKPIIPFGIYRADVLDDGTMIVGHWLCLECASKYGLSTEVIVSGEVCFDEGRFPYVCPTCAQCFKEWSVQDAK